jgi:uncharacterized protein YeaO (DUF488 family)
MSVHHYRYGEPPARPGLRIGVTRHLPRGVPKAEYATRGYFDVWLPLLAPSRELVSAYRDDRVTRAQFARRYRAELANPAARQAIRLLAAMAVHQPVHLGCFCADAGHCHRTLLQDLITAAAAELPPGTGAGATYASPACSMPEIVD